MGFDGLAEGSTERVLGRIESLHIPQVGSPSPAPRAGAVRPEAASQAADAQGEAAKVGFLLAAVDESKAMAASPVPVGTHVEKGDARMTAWAKPPRPLAAKCAGRVRELDAGLG